VWIELNLIGSRQGHVESYCKHSNEPSCSIKATIWATTSFSRWHLLHGVNYSNKTKRDAAKSIAVWWERHGHTLKWECVRSLSCLSTGGLNVDSSHWNRKVQLLKMELINQLLATESKRSSDAQLAKKCPVFYGTRRFITWFTRVHHWALFLIKFVQSTPLHLFLQ
jgi:hypothetical protein